MYAGIAKNHQQDSATAISLTRRSPFSSAGPRTATRTFPIGAGFVAKRGDDAEVPVLLHDAILRNAHVGALILGLVLGGLSVFGLIRWPHGVWAAPIACAALALGANQRLRHATGRVEVILLGVLTLALLIGAGLLAKVAVGVAR
jgi:hypothetical protein